VTGNKVYRIGENEEKRKGGGMSRGKRGRGEKVRE